MRQLTPMQAAYWVGRKSSESLGGVSAHLYAEFDGEGIDPVRLRFALQRLSVMHPMLRARIDADGLQATVEVGPELQVEDLRHLSGQVLEERLATIRATWTHQQLDLAAGQPVAFALSRLPGDANRLHVDTDMVAIDPVSFRIVMEDLAWLYEHEEAQPAVVSPGFFDWLDRMNTDSNLKERRQRDRTWWKGRLSQVPPAPALPLKVHERAVAASSTRYSAWLSVQEHQSLREIAQGCRVSTSTLMLGLFAQTLGAATKSERFRLNVPMFYRAPAVEQVDKIVGDFSNLLILGAELLAADTLGGLCRKIGAEMSELLTHCTHPGVSVMRDLSRHHGSMQISPVVFTAGLDMVQGDLLSPRVSHIFGPMTWVVSQSPQVALDAQVAAMDGGVLINWDVRLDALPESWAESTFQAYVSLVRALIATPGLVAVSLDDPRFGAVAVACRTGEQVRAQERAANTERMLLQLLGRVGDGRAVSADCDLVATGFAQAQLKDLFGFVNRYIPSAGLSCADLNEYPSPGQLAGLVCDRSAGASERVAGALLKALQAGS